MHSPNVLIVGFAMPLTVQQTTLPPSHVYGTVNSSLVDMQASECDDMELKDDFHIQRMDFT